MAIELNDNIDNKSPKILDKRYSKNDGTTPYATVLEANTLIPLAYRALGLTVLIGNVEYWYKDGITDVDLVIKSSGGSISGTLNRISMFTPDGSSLGDSQIYQIPGVSVDSENFSIGRNNTFLNNDLSTIIGQNNYLENGYQNFLVGFNASSVNDYSVILLGNAIVSNQNTGVYVLGDSNYIDNSIYSNVVGEQNAISLGNYISVQGLFNTIDDSINFAALGFSNYAFQAQGSSIVGLNNSITESTNSSIIGNNNTITTSDLSTIIGNYNTLNGYNNSVMIGYLNRGVFINEFGDVGVGTLAPGAKIDILSSGSGYGNYLLRMTNGTTAVKFQMFENGETYFDPGSGYQTVKHVSGRWDFPNNVNIGGGFVGDSQLYVRGQSATSSDFSIKATDIAGKPILVARNDKLVGINLASPSYNLDIFGSFQSGYSASNRILHNGSIFHAKINDNNWIGVNRDGLQITEMWASASVLMYNTTTGGSISISSVTNTNITENTVIRFKRTDNYHYGYWDSTNYKLKIGSIGLTPTAATSALHIENMPGYAQLRLATTYTPTGSGDPNGNTGDYAWDDNFVYVKVSTGWKRASLNAF